MLKKLGFWIDNNYKVLFYFINMTQIILATTSPNRKKLFDKIGVPYISEASNVEEHFEGRPDTPRELVAHLARLKAEAVAKKHNSGIIIGFDSVMYFQGEILEKPKSQEESFERLKRLSGNFYHYYTGIYMINLDNNKILADVVISKALMRVLKDKEILKYLDQDPHFKTRAGGFSPPEHYSTTFIKRIEGSYNNILWGLPLERIMEMLFEIGHILS